MTQNAAKRYEHFLSSTQEPLRLADALEGYFDVCSSAEQCRGYRTYLQHHLRPALDRLAALGHVGQIRKLMEEGMVSSVELEQLIHRTQDAGLAVSWQRLLRLKFAKTSPKIQHSDEATSADQRGVDPHAVLRTGLLKLYDAFPFLDGAISALTPVPLPRLHSGPLPQVATDGVHLFYGPDGLQTVQSADPALVRRSLFHLLLHCLLGHLWQKSSPGPNLCTEDDPQVYPDLLVHAAMDIHIEFLIERSCRGSRVIRDLLGSLPIPGSWTGLFDRMSGNIWSPEKIIQEVPRKTLLDLAGQLARDDHAYWPEDNVTQRQWALLAQDALRQESQLPAGPNAARDAGHFRQNLIPGGGKPTGSGPGGSRIGAAGFGIGITPGNDSFPAGIIARGTYDYRSFLHRFSVFREEMEPDLSSFDPIWYTFGLQRYRNLALIEPPETREGYRLEQLVIAIDTSGSCKTPMVRRFLEETRSILEEKENFFRRMNVWILQCDCIVQDAVNIRCREDWDAYLRTLTISGRSGTDFRPVFRYVEKLRQDGKLTDLGALIYFTDGDGIYPHEAPDYETAFVFVKEPEDGIRAPAWAAQLVVPEQTNQN